MPAIDLGYLLRAGTQGLTGYRQGQQAKQQADEARQRQQAQDLFAQYAKQQQLEAQAEANRIREEQGTALNDIRAQQAKAAAEAAANKQALADFVARNGSYKDVNTVGPEGTARVVPPQVAQIGATSREAVGRGNNEATLEAARIRAAAQGAAQGQGARPTEAQDKNMVFHNLLRRGNATMEQARQSDPAIDLRKVLAYFSRPLFKPALSPAEQVFAQGAREFAAGVKRRESGANVTEKETAETLARYIDLGYDAPETQAAKKAAREAYEEDLRRQALPAEEYYRKFEGGSPSKKSASPDQSEVARKAAINKVRKEHGLPPIP